MENQLEYFLPKKGVKLLVKYVLKEQLSYNEDNDLEETVVQECYIQEDVTVEFFLHPDYTLKRLFDYSKHQSFLFQLSLETEFDENGAGMLQAINIESTPVLPEILSGVVEVASSLIKLGTGVVMAAPPAEAQLLRVEVKERIVPKYYLIDTDEMELQGEEYTITLPPLALDGATLPVPTVTVSIQPAPSYPREQAPASTQTIFYREPVLSKVKVKIHQNGSIHDQTAIEEYVYFPQFGSLKSIALKAGNIFNKAGNKLRFCKNTGGLLNFSLTSESNIKESLAGYAASATTINSLLGEVRKSKKDEITAREEKQKALAKAEQDGALARLKREKELLEKEKEILTLKQELEKLRK